jgi:hypothetical protein
MDERTWFDITVRIDMKVDTSSGNTAFWILPVIPKIQTNISFYLYDIQFSK